MNPDILTFGDITISVMPFLMILAFILGFTLGFFDARKRGMNPWIALKIGVVSNLVGFLGAKILFIIIRWEDFLIYTEYFFGFGGLSVMGAMLGALGTIFFYAHRHKINPLDIIDLFLPYWAIGYMLVRVGCFMGGCCYGKVTDLPWGVIMVRVDNLPRHPVQLYVILLFLLFYPIYFYGLRRLNVFRGFHVFLAPGTYGLLRFFTEFFRDGEVFWLGLTSAQLASLGMIFFSLTVTIVAYHKTIFRRSKGFGAE